MSSIIPSFIYVVRVKSDYYQIRKRCLDERINNKRSTRNITKKYSSNFRGNALRQMIIFHTVKYNIAFLFHISNKD